MEQLLKTKRNSRPKELRIVVLNHLIYKKYRMIRAEIKKRKRQEKRALKFFICFSDKVLFKDKKQVNVNYKTSTTIVSNRKRTFQQLIAQDNDQFEDHELPAGKRFKIMFEY